MSMKSLLIPRRAVRYTAIVAALMLALAACSQDADEAVEVATLESTESALGSAADAAVAGDDDDSDLAPDEAALEFSQCMRDQGLDFPDLAVNAEGNIELRDAIQTVDPGAEGFREAMDACDDILQQTGFGGQGRAARESTEFQDALVEFSACLRDEGFDVGDLTLGAPGAGGQPPGGGGAEAGDGGGAGQQGQRAQGFGDRGARFAENLGLDYDDPAVEEAVTECLTGVDEALANLGAGQPVDQG